MRIYSVLLVLFLPGAAYAAEETGTTGFSFVTGFLQMIASLAIVVGVILLTYHLANRFLKGNLVKKSVPRYIRVVENRFLAPKKSLMLVEVGGEYLLLGSTETGLNLIKQVDMLETIEIVEELTAASRPSAGFRDWARSLSELIQKRVGVAAHLGKRTV